MSEKIFVIPPERTRYLSEISENNRAYDKWVNQQVVVAEKLHGLHSSIETLKESDIEDRDRLIKNLQEVFEKEKLNFDPKNWELIQNWEQRKQAFKNPVFEFKVRDKVLKLKTHTESLSHSHIPKVASPNYRSWGDILKWILQENFPGDFPYTSGLFPFKREGEDPTRMFAGEGGPERTNKRFHYFSL
jgi:methylmalonyl-CoA mutase